MKQCLMHENETCVDCGECERCDFDEMKICDNCCECLQSEADYMEVGIDSIAVDENQESDAQKKRPVS